MALRWQEQGGQRLHLVDLDGAKQGRPINLDSIRSILKVLKIPCELGGGIRDESSIRLMLEEIGIDRVIVGTQALKQPEWFRSMVEKYPHRLALGLDARNSMVATAGWLEVSQVAATDLAQKFIGIPLAAVIYTNIANDGMMQGVDQATIQDMIGLADSGLPVIASGGVTTNEDVKRLAETHRDHPNLIGAIIGRAIYEGTIKLPEALQTVDQVLKL